MRKKLIVMIGLSVAVVLALPMIAFSVEGGSASMAIAFLSWSFLDPVFAIAMGCISGKEYRELWWFPAVPAVFTFASVMLLSHYLRDALLYGAVVLIVGAAGLLVTAGIYTLLERCKEKK